MSTSSRAVIRFSIGNKNTSRINYSRRMYAIIRRYTPEVIESGESECYAELTGLRTFFKMTYNQIAQNIIKDLRSELGFTCKLRVISGKEYDQASKYTKKSRSITTYKEINRLFLGASFVQVNKRKQITAKKKIRLTVPFIGKVA